MNEMPAPAQNTAAGPQKVRAAALSVATSSTLAVLKLIIGLWSGSVSILSEAVHSGTDLIASGIALISVRASDAPPDHEHPYGHGKVESLSGLFEAMLILGAAGYILYQNLQRLREPHIPLPHSLSAGIEIMAVSIVANLTVSSYIAKIGKTTDSQALTADAAHLRADVLSSLGVLVGLVLARATGITWLDPAVAVVVAFILFATAIRLMRDAVQLLLDYRLPDSEEARIREALDSDTRVMSYHKLRTRKSGSQRHADVHVQMEDDWTLVYSHQVAEELEDAIRAVLPGITINIHIEPFDAELQHQRDAHGVM